MVAKELNSSSKSNSNIVRYGVFGYGLSFFLGRLSRVSSGFCQ